MRIGVENNPWVTATVSRPLGVTTPMKAKVPSTPYCSMRVITTVPVSAAKV